MSKLKLSDESIKKALADAAAPISMKAGVEEAIRAEIQSKNKKENTYMRLTTFKKAAIAVGVFCITSITCLAAVNRGSLISVTRDRYNDPAAITKVEKEIQYSPKFVEEFSDGYKFKEMTINEIAEESADTRDVKESKGVMFDYIKDNDQFLIDTQKSVNIDSEELKEAQKTVYNNIEINYLNTLYKFVPVDYELTEEDKQAEKNGELTISYGTDEVEILTMQQVVWTDGGIDYVLSYSGDLLGAEELIQIAKEVINK